MTSSNSSRAPFTRACGLGEIYRQRIHRLRAHLIRTPSFFVDAGLEEALIASLADAEGGNASAAAPPASKHAVKSLVREQLSEERLQQLGGTGTQCAVCRYVPCMPLTHPSSTARLGYTYTFACGKDNLTVLALFCWQYVTHDQKRHSCPIQRPPDSLLCVTERVT